MSLPDELEDLWIQVNQDLQEAIRQKQTFTAFLKWLLPERAKATNLVFSHRYWSTRISDGDFYIGQNAVALLKLHPELGLASWLTLDGITFVARLDRRIAEGHSGAREGPVRAGEPWWMGDTAAKGRNGR